MLPDILLLLLVIFTPISKWCFSLQTPPLRSNQWVKELQQLLMACYLREAFAQPSATTVEVTEKTLMQFWKDHNKDFA